MAEEKIEIPSNEEILEVTTDGDEIKVEDMGNKESAKIVSEHDKKDDILN